MTALECLEKLVDNKLESVNKDLHFGFGFGRLTNDFHFGKNCSVRYYECLNNKITLIIIYGSTDFEQDIIKNTPEHAKLILLFDKIRKYIAERDKQDLLNYINS